jgi:flagellar hook-basal body complex protein FliE
MDGIRGLPGLSDVPGPIAAPERTSAGPGFSELLSGAIQKVDALQGQADGEAQKLALGGGNLHETAIALEKADVALRVLTRVRNKVVEAYQEVMRMNV